MSRGQPSSSFCLSDSPAILLVTTAVSTQHYIIFLSIQLTPDDLFQFLPRSRLGSLDSLDNGPAAFHIFCYRSNEQAWIQDKLELRQQKEKKPSNVRPMLPIMSRMLRILESSPNGNPDNPKETAASASQIYARCRSPPREGRDDALPGYLSGLHQGISVSSPSVSRWSTCARG